MMLSSGLVSFAGIATLFPIVEDERLHKAAAVEGLIRWMAENSGFLKKRRGYNELKIDWAAMIQCWEFTKELRSNFTK